jgi:hypothetical protein
MMNDGDEMERFWKDVSWPIQCTISVFVWRDRGKPQKTPVRIACVRAEI